jgi:hypothetical protein
VAEYPYVPALRLRRLARVVAPAAAVMLLVAAVPASADTVVPNNQIVQGFQCLGPLCADGEPMSGHLYLTEKSQDTPGVRLTQTPTAGYPEQTWDVAGNETNFFIRDATGGNLLPFRIRPGAPTSSIDIGATGEVSTAGVVQQTVHGLAPTAPFDGEAALAALRTLTISHYTIGGATHALPAGTAFRAAFGLGGSDDDLAAQDVAAVALAAVKALDARVSAIALTPGPKGDTGANGANGARGDRGATGDAGATGPAPTTDLGRANARIAALERSNAKLAKSLAALRKEVRAVVKVKGTKRKATQAGAHRTTDGR